jgi:hypothetical protein
MNISWVLQARSRRFTAAKSLGRMIVLGRTALKGLGHAESQFTTITREERIDCLFAIMVLTRIMSHYSSLSR